jgi:hypothetical protein
LKELAEIVQIIFYVLMVLGVGFGVVKGQKIKGFKIPPIDVRLANNGEPLQVNLSEQDRDQLMRLERRLECIEAKIPEKGNSVPAGPPGGPG